MHSWLTVANLEKNRRVLATVKARTLRKRTFLFNTYHAILAKPVDDKPMLFLQPLKRQENLHLKMSSVYVVCWIFLQIFETYFFCIQANNVDPDPLRAVWSGSKLFEEMLLKSQADDKADDNCCDWQFKVKKKKAFLINYPLSRQFTWNAKSNPPHPHPPPPTHTIKKKKKKEKHKTKIIIKKCLQPINLPKTKC